MTQTKTLRIAPLLALAVLAAATLAGCGGSEAGPAGQGAEVRWFGPQRPIAGLHQRTVGAGAGVAVLLWSRGKPPPRQAVVFLHGWLPEPPSAYGEWLGHLARRGNTIVYPAYRRLRAKPKTFRAAALAGIRAGLEAADADPGAVVAIGYVTGGALAFDYAATAAQEGLPSPAAVLAVYPARNPPTGEIPAAELSRIPPRTRLAVIAGPGDPIPGGDAQARALLGAARRVPPPHRRYIEAPAPKSLLIRPSFHTAADRLIAAARGAPTPP